MEDVGCVSSDLRKKHKNTQNTKGVTLFICPFEAEKKTQKHLGVKKYKDTQLLREKILVFMVKKHKIT